MMLPILYAPLLPLIRIGLRGRVSQPVMDRIFLGAVGVALTHAGLPSDFRAGNLHLTYAAPSSSFSRLYHD